MMKNYNQSVKIYHNLNLRYIPDHPYTILIDGSLINGQILTKYVYMSKIDSSQCINCFSTEEKK